MSKNCAVLIGLTFVAFSSPSLAAPVDSPDTIYIDGLPCGRACQSYMAWSRAARPRQSDQEPAPVEQAPPPSVTAAKAVKAREAYSKATGSRVAKKPAVRPAVSKTQLASRPEAASAPTEPAGSSPEDPAQAPHLADKNEQTSSIPLPQNEVTAPGQDDKSDTVDPQSAVAPSETAALSPPSTEERIAIVLVRPDIKTASDLTKKVVAIDGAQSNSLDDVRNAIAAAGATDVQVNLSESLALLRIMNGEVPAAVVDLLPPKAAESWSGALRGFNVLRIPLRAAIGGADRG